MTQARRLPIGEFIALMAMTFGMVAFSIDAMLPALPEIAAEISPDNLNRAQLVLTSFVLGMGIGTLFTGPLSDTFGRKRVIFWAAVLYVVGAVLASMAQSMDTMIAARVLQGLGVAGPRVVSLAIVRDLYQGREMARIVSYAMIIFTLVPAVAPAVGALIIHAAGWRAIFLAFVVLAVVVVGWMVIRQAETLPPDRRRPFHVSKLTSAITECFTHRVFCVSTAAQALTFGMLFSGLSSTQQIFSETFGRAETFPAWFALVALLGGLASLLNARLVLGLGMQRLIYAGYLGQAIMAASVLLSALFGPIPFGLYILWTVSIFFMAGLVIGNLNALAMEPLGHIAGMAASVLGSVSTTLSLIFAIPIGLAFNGTPIPLALGTLSLSVVGLLLIRYGLTHCQTTS